MSDVVNHPIKDNTLRINNVEYHALDLDRVIVGVENPERNEILRDQETGLNYSRNAVEGQEIFNYNTQKRSCWFILDLETGKRGWFPGCVIHGNILGQNIPLKQQPSDSSETLELLSEVIVTVLDIKTPQDQPYPAGWYRVKFNVEGYVQASALTDLRYEAPF